MSVSVTVLCCAVALGVVKYVKGLWDVGFLPGLRPLYSPLSPLGAILPDTTWTYGPTWTWRLRKTSFMNFSRDIISVVPILPGKTCYYTCSIDVMKQILGNEVKLHPVKPWDLTLARLLGDSLPSVSGEIWQRHRRVVAPAFGAKTLSSAWQEAIDVYGQMVQAEGWERADEVVLPEIHPLMLKVTLLVLAKSGFGMPTSWSRPADAVDITQSLYTVSETLIPRMIFPRWSYSLPIESLRSMDKAWSDVMSFVSTAIAARKAEQQEQNVDDADLPGDVLNRLVAASSGLQRHGMTEEEMVANMLSILFAGHETTASALVTTLAYLALYQDEQEKAFLEIQQIQNVPSPIDTSQLQHVLGCFLEAQRLCPAPLFLPRMMTEDVPITVTRPTQETFVLKKGRLLIFDLVGIFRNPHMFEEPDVFRPSRWAHKTENELGMFGFGPRVCVGRKFAQQEALGFITSLLRDWRLDIVLQPGETRAQYVDRVMGAACMKGTAFGLSSVPLKLVRRKM